LGLGSQERPSRRHRDLKNLERPKGQGPTKGEVRIYWGFRKSFAPSISDYREASILLIDGKVPEGLLPKGDFQRKNRQNRREKGQGHKKGKLIGRSAGKESGGRGSSPGAIHEKK